MEIDTHGNRVDLCQGGVYFEALALWLVTASDLGYPALAVSAAAGAALVHDYPLSLFFLR